MKTCQVRLESGAPIPVIPHRTRGKKRKACDRCIRLKRGCNAGLPCSTCISKRHACMYTDSKQRKSTSENPSEYTTPPDAFGNDLNDLPCLDLGFASPLNQLDGIQHPRLPTPGHEITQDWPDLSLSPTAISWSYEFISLQSQSSLTTCNKFEFLARHTGSKGILNCFNCRNISPRRYFSLSGTQESDSSSDASSHGFEDFPILLDRSDDFEPTSLERNLQAIYQKCEPTKYTRNGTVDPFDQWAVHPLAFKTQEIVTRLKETIRHKPRRSLVMLEWSALVEKMCFHFFSPPNLCRYLEAFWVSWYPNCPIVHKPSFDPIHACPILLASMAIIGSCVSLRKQDNQNAEIWFDAVEETVFDDEALQEEYLDVCVNMKPSRKPQRLEALQAAFFVCIFQNWEGSELTQRRIRRRRYSTVVAVSRTIYQEAKPINSHIPRSQEIFLQDPLFTSHFGL